MTKQTKVILSIGFLLLSFGCVGCGGGVLAFLHYVVEAPIFEESKKTTLEKFQPQYDVKRKKVKDMARGIAGKGFFPHKAKTFDPPPIYVKKGDLSTRNCDIIMEDVAADPDKQKVILDDTKDIVGYDPEDLARHLAWTGPSNPMAVGELDKRSSGFDKLLQKSLDRKYVIVFRAPDYKEDFQIGGRPRTGIATVVGHLFADNFDVPTFVWKVEVAETINAGDFSGSWKKNALPKLKAKLSSEFQSLTGGKLELD